MLKRFRNFHSAWQFLNGHSAFNRPFVGFAENDFVGSLQIYAVKVNPKTKAIDDDPKKNTVDEVWLECGPWMIAREIAPRGAKIPKWFDGAFSHDPDLDCGGATFEKAIIRLANLVALKYGDK